MRDEHEHPLEIRNAPQELLYLALTAAPSGMAQSGIPDRTWENGSLNQLRTISSACAPDAMTAMMTGAIPRKRMAAVNPWPAGIKT